MAAPEWTKDEKALEDAKDFLRQGSTIDFFEEVAAAILREHPANLAQFCKDLVMEKRSGKAPRQEGEFQPKREDDMKYMRSHNVSDFLDKWILALLSARPDSDAGRLDFHESYLRGLSTA